MQKLLALICFHLGFWGILGFFITLIAGFLTCCAGLSQTVFWSILGIFAFVGLSATCVCVGNGCKKHLDHL
jgi:hypothetical protein